MRQGDIHILYYLVQMVHSLSTGSEQFVYPSARKAHTCVVHDGMVYMVGGVNKKHAQEGEVTKDIWIFDLDTKKWLTFEKVWCGPTPPSVLPGIFRCLREIKDQLRSL